MTAKAGRLVVVAYREVGDTEYITIGALKEKSFSFDNPGIEITTDDDSGWRKFLDDASSTRSATLKLSGVLKDRTFQQFGYGQVSLEMQFTVPGVEQITGTFRFTAVENKASLEDAVSYDYTFESSGTVTASSPS